MNGGDHTTEYNKWKEQLEKVRTVSTNTYWREEPPFVNWDATTSAVRPDVYDTGRYARAVTWDNPIDRIKYYRFDVDHIKDIHMYDDGQCDLTASGYDYEVTLMLSKKATEALLSKLDITCYKAASEEEIDKFLE